MPETYFNKLLLVFILIGAWEFSGLIKLKNTASKIAFLFSIGASAIIIQSNSDIIIYVLYIAIFWWVLNLHWVLSYPEKTSLWFKPLTMRIVNGFLLLIPMFLALTILQQQHGPEYFLLLMLVIWGADSGAYFTGKAFGKHKLSPKVSPGKSIEGVVGGIGSATIIMFIFLQYQNIPAEKHFGFLILAIVVSSVSVLGDLFESLFKRVSNIKDSSNILPGHGGILDRIDSLTAAAPFFLIGLSLL